MMSPRPPRPASAATGAAAALLYGVTAVSMGFVNKAVLTVYGMRESNFLLLAQMCLTVLVLGALRAANQVSFPRVNVATAKKLAPVAILYNANVAFALASLSKVSVPTYNTLKRLTPAVVLLANKTLRPQKPDPSRGVVGSISLVVLGCIVAGAGDLAFDLAGYLSGVASCLLQATYLIVVEITGAERGVGSAELLAYNALLSTPIVFALTSATGELASAVTRLGTLSEGAGFVTCFVGALSMGMLLNYSQFLCTMKNSALTTTVVGVLKGVASTALGFVLLGGVKFSLWHVVGITLNSVGGVMYSYVTFHERRRARAKLKESRSDVFERDGGGSGGGGGGLSAAERGGGHRSPRGVGVA